MNDKINANWLKEVGFYERISYELKISEGKFLSIAWNDKNKWYAFFRNENPPLINPISNKKTSGTPDDIVTLMDDILYKEELKNLVRVLSKGRIELYTKKELRKEKLKKL